MYEQVTSGIRIQVQPSFLDHESDPENGKYVWAYRVVIANETQSVVQLLRRYWRITDARGRVQEVRGEGVVGEKPVLQPGQAFEYVSGAPLETSSGMMSGQYEMVDLATGAALFVDIPAFSLDDPNEKRSVN